MMPPTYVRSFGEEIFLKMVIIILSETEKRRNEGGAESAGV